MPQGGPADATNFLQFYGYKKTFAEGMIGYGSAIAGTGFLLSAVLSLAYLRLLTGFAAVVVYCLFPFLWFVLTSLKTQGELTAIPPKLIPGFQLDFYRSALGEHHLLRYVANSLIVAVS